MTPDDVGYAKADGPDKKRERARQNVVLEMGMLISSLTRKNVAILKHISVEQPSDAAGIKYIPFEADVRECAQQLIQRLQNSGIEIDPERIAKF
jgi:predicted nucleotide-binding protein